MKTGATVVADARGQFEFTDMALEVGESNFNLRVVDVAGNSTELAQTITFTEPDLTSLTITAELLDDTGVY